MSREKLAERIKLTRGALNKANFAKSLGVSPSYITELESGSKENISDMFAELISLKYNINRTWLLTGEGSMFKKLPISEAEPTKLIPVLGRVPAGFPENVSEEVIEYISLPSAPPGSYALVVKGDSMSPGIRDGDYVLFIQDGDYKNGDVIVVNNEFGESMIKRYRLKDGEVWLFSDNPEYPSFRPNEQYRMIGRVVKAWREIKI